MHRLRILSCYSLNEISGSISHEVALLDESLNARPNRIREECHSPSRDFASLPNDNCMLGEKENNQSTAFLFGDSHANHITGFLDVLGKDSGSRIQDYTMDQCPPIFGFAWGRSSRVAEMCEQRNENAREFIDSNDFDFVILSASWPYPLSARLYVEGERLMDADQRMAIINQQLEFTIEEIINAGATPVLFDDVSSVVEEDPRCPIRKAAFDEERTCTTAQDTNSFMVEIFDGLEARYDSIRRVQPADLYCANDICELAINGIPIYHDADHLNEIASQELAREFLESNNNPLSP